MLIEAIDQYLATRPKNERRINCFHPSSLHKSVDYLFKAYFEGDSNKELEPRVLRVFNNGHAVHERLQKYLKESSVLLDAEVEVQNQEYEISGTCDGIIKLGNKKGVLEIKSINQNGFYALHEPKPEHLIQINVYMFCLDIPRGCILYENKDNQELKEFYVKLNNETLNPILEKITNVQEQIQRRNKSTDAEIKNKNKDGGGDCCL